MHETHESGVTEERVALVVAQPLDSGCYMKGELVRGVPGGNTTCTRHSSNAIRTRAQRRAAHARPGCEKIDGWVAEGGRGLEPPHHHHQTLHAEGNISATEIATLDLISRG